MKRLIGLIVLAAVILFLALGIGRSRQVEETESIEDIQAREGIPVIAEPARIGEISLTRRFYGDVKAARVTSVNARLMERIDDVLVAVGDRVSVDQPLVSFDTTASQAAVVQLRLAMLNAERDLQRIRSLWEQKAVSRQMYDAAELQHEIAFENYKTARRAVVLHAPVSGRVARVNFKDGDFVNPGDEVLSILGNDRLIVELDVSRQDRVRIRKGQKVTVRAGDGQPVEGVVTHVSLETEPESRMFSVKAEIPPGDGLLPGVLATVDLTLDHRSNVVTVPADALISRGEKTEVVVIRDGKALIKPVRAGLRGEDRVEIRSGLNTDDIVAVYGHNEIEDGTRVRVVTE